MDFTDITAYGGREDIAAAVERAFADGKLRLYIPSGKYILNKEIKLPSGAYIKAEPDAHIVAKAGFTDKAMVSNTEAGNEKGNVDITVDGGIWDGNCGENVRPSYYDAGILGLMFEFRNVTGLKLLGIVGRNASCYHIRLGEVKDFLIENLKFDGELTPLCQDGVHMGGGCENGIIRNVRAEPGTMGDDLIALNADDVFWYGANRDMKPLPIRNITVENVDAPNCFTGIRILSIFEEVSHIRFRNFKIGYRTHGINLDAARHCADPIPIFKNEKLPDGVGNIRDVVFENFEFWYTGKPELHCSVVLLESNLYDTHFINMRHVREKDVTDVVTFRIRYTGDADFGEKFIEKGTDRVSNLDFYENLTVNSRAEVPPKIEYYNQK